MELPFKVRSVRRWVWSLCMVGSVWRGSDPYVTHSRSVDGRAEPAICTIFGLRFGATSDGMAFHVLRALVLSGGMQEQIIIIIICGSLSHTVKDN